MTTEPTELDKAIKHGEIARDALVAGNDAYKCLDGLLSAAKHLKEVEKERDELLIGVGRLGTLATSQNEWIEEASETLIKLQDDWISSGNCCYQTIIDLRDYAKELQGALELMENGKYGRRHMASQIMEMEQQLSQLRADLKQCGIYAKDIKNFCDYRFRQDGLELARLCIEDADIIIALPSVQEALKK